MIKVPKSPNDMPPMDALGGDMGQSMNMMGDMGADPSLNAPDGADSEFDSGFDAGVEADPTEDPKKYIQQLSGKLSQELRKFNDNQEQPDEELNKYVAGMIIPQASQGLTDKGKKEIIGKIKQGVTDDDNTENTDDAAPSDDQQPIEEPTMESINHHRTIVEIMNQIFDDSDKQKQRGEKKVNKQIKSRNPFVANR